MKFDIKKHQDTLILPKPSLVKYEDYKINNELLKKLEILDNLKDKKKQILIKTMLMESLTKGYADIRKAIIEYHN